MLSPGFCYLFLCDLSSLSIISLKMIRAAFFSQINNLSVLWVTGLKNLGRIGTNIFLQFFFLEKKYNFMHFERHLAFQNA